jgi:hypothetical protein
MRILAANLKHLYQRRILWLFYIYLGLIILSSVTSAINSPKAVRHFVWFLTHEFLIGNIAALLQIEVLNKPFSYCLPNHRKVVRTFILWIGIVTNLLVSLLFFMYPGLYSWERILAVVSVFFAGLTFYWFGVGFAFASKNFGTSIAFAWWIIFIPLFLEPYNILENFIIQYFIFIVFIGVLSSIIAWFRLGSEGIARRYCAVPWLGLFDLWNREKLLRYQQARMSLKWDKKLKTHPKPWVERFFLARMQEYDLIRTGRYIWGGLYITFGVAISHGIENLLGFFILLLFAVSLSYAGGGIVAFMFYVLPAVFMVARIRLPVYSSMLISGGRNEKFLTAMTLVSTIAVLITVLLTAFAALSASFEPIMPDIPFLGSKFIFHAMSLKPFFVPLLMIPIVFTIQLFFFKKPYFVMVTIMLLAMLLFAGGPLLKMLSTLINPIYIVIGLLVLSWAIFVIALRYICMKRCLVG